MAIAKNIYTVFDRDSGQISMSNQVFDDPDGRYGNVLNEREMRFVNHGGPTHAHLGRDFVANDGIARRPQFRISIDRTRIRAGGNDVARITGIPRGVVVTLAVMMGGASHTVERLNFDGPAIELPAPVPGLYTVTITRWPYRDWTRTIEAIA